MYTKLFLGFLGIMIGLSLSAEERVQQNITSAPSASPNNALSLSQGLSQKNYDLPASNQFSSSDHPINSLISMVFETHPNIKMYQHAVKGAEAGVDGAKWNYFPTPTIGTNYSTKHIDGTTVSLEQPLWTGGKLDAAYDMAIANKDASQYSLKESGYLLVETLLNTLQAYLKAKEDLVALHNGKERLNRLEEMIIRREDSGVSSKADIELLRARVYQIETNINATKNKKAIALAQLELLIGRKLGSELDFKNFPIYACTSSDNVVKSMISQHPTLEKLDAQIAYAKAERDKAKAAVMPNVSIKAQKIYGSSSLYYQNNENDAIVYLSVQASPGAGLSSLATREMAEVKIMQLTQEKNSKKQDLIDKTLTAYNNYLFADSRIGIQENSINASQNVFESYIRLFLTGKRQWLDLVTASRELTDNELGYNETRIMHLIASYQLALLDGKFNTIMRLNNDDL